jgi:hypothetical protein
VRAGKRPRCDARLGVACLVVLIGSVGCGTSGPSNAQLEKAARAVPVPAGVSFVGVNKTEMQTGLGATREVNVSYSNPSLSCAQLAAAWIATLAKAGRATEPYTPGDGQIFLKNPRMTLGITLGGIETCPDPFVGAQSK